MSLSPHHSYVMPGLLGMLIGLFVFGDIAGANTHKNDQDRGSTSCTARLAADQPSPTATPSASLLLCRGKVLLADGDSNRALASLAEAREKARQEQDHHAFLDSSQLLAEIHQLHNQHDLAFPILTEAYELAEQQGLSKIKEDVLNALATAYYNSGRFELAEKYYQELLAHGDRNNDPAGVSITAFNLAHAYASQGKHEQADAAFSRSYALSQQLDDVVGSAYTLKAWGENASAQNQLELATERLERALAIFDEQGEINQKGAVLRHLGDIAVKRGTPVEASVYYLSAIPILEQQQFERALLRSYRGLAKAYAQAGDFRQAYTAQEIYLEKSRLASQRELKETSQRLQAEFDVRFNTQKLADHNAGLALKNAQQLQQIEYDRLWRIGLVIVALLALFATTLLWLLWRKGRKHSANMEYFARVDELTQIPNRRSILELGANAWARTEQTGESFSVMILDIDHFKSVNDTYGHGVGDVVLKGVAATAQTALRKTDNLGRYGGEEFLIITTEMELSQTLMLAERVRAAIASCPFAEIGNKPVTVSIGVAQTRTADSLNDMIKQADEALYEAKEKGRNQVRQYAIREDLIYQSDRISAFSQSA